MHYKKSKEEMKEMTKRQKQIKTAQGINPKELIKYLDNPSKNKSMASRKYGVSVPTIDRIASKAGRPDIAAPSVAKKYSSEKERKVYSNPTNVEKIRKEAVRDFLTNQLKGLS
jgi:hypothetical protein